MKPYAGEWPLGTTWRYESGTIHAAYDIKMPIGTELYAENEGIIADCADGSPNDPPGGANYPNEPSNWVLLWTKWKGKPVTVYYQHMSPNLHVHKGQIVNEGHLIGHSGNSGNSTGPHLHLATQWGHTYDRYRYDDNDGQNPWIIFPPDQLWRNDEMPLSDKEVNDIAERVADKIAHRKVFGPDATKDEQKVSWNDTFRKLWKRND